ncbi:MAG: DUF1256 domain-containing protein [Christensenellales bacterium]
MLKEYSKTRDDLKNFAYELMRNLRKGYYPVFLCVGSDKFVCDSLAPIVAELLRKKYNIKAYVYGGLDYNINASNLVQAVNYIETEHPYSSLVLIDATLGNNVGSIRLTNGSFAGLGRELPIKKIGQISILGVVGRKGKNFDLNSTRLKVVTDLAQFISQGCAMAVWKLSESLK